MSDLTAPNSAELTLMLHHAHDGNELARKQLFQAVYADLRSLVHESYVRMLGSAVEDMPNRRVFFAYACKVMRSVIVDYVRERDAEKRGNGQPHVTLMTEIAGESVDETQVMAIHQALEQLKLIDERCHDVVELRYFGGFTLDECADLLGISSITVGRDWEKARLFLSYRLGDG